MRISKSAGRSGVSAGAYRAPPVCSQLVTISLCDANHDQPPAKGGSTSTVWPFVSVCGPVADGDAVTQERTPLAALGASSGPRSREGVDQRGDRCAGRRPHGLGLDACGGASGGEVPHGDINVCAVAASRSAADRAHRAVRLHEVGVVDAVARRLGPHRGAPRRLERRHRRRRVRISARRSVSSRENRQLRTWPSAVSRVRSQAEQNASDTDAMMPTVAGPPSTRHSCAGAEPRGAGSGVSVEVPAAGWPARSSAPIVVPRDHSWPASSGICSMMRSW